MKDLFNKNSFTIPNLLSLIRILLIPVFAVLFYDKQYIAAVIVLAVSGLTDLFDGKIARKFNQISELGKILDPVADKLTQITIAVMLYLAFFKSTNSYMHAFSWIFLIFLIKEVVFIGSGLVMLSRGMRPTAAEIYGKVATFVFYAVMIMVIAVGPEVGAFNNIWTMPEWLTITLVAISAIATIVAFLGYLPGTVQQYKDDIAQKAKNKK